MINLLLVKIIQGTDYYNGEEYYYPEDIQELMNELIRRSLFAFIIIGLIYLLVPIILFFTERKKEKDYKNK
ncbi:MAG: hypothetical protein PHX62_04955 [Bacilli bacterium]|nr:hypothetical protein [Bacilli bacterium]